MQGIFTPETANVLSTICVGLFLVYFALKRIIANMDKDDNEPTLWFLWRFISGIGCVILGVLGLSILSAMINNPSVVAACRANGLNPAVVILLLFVLSCMSAIFNAFMPKAERVLGWSGQVIRKPKPLRPDTYPGF